MKPKKKGYAKHKATFLKIEDAVFWEEHVKKNLAVDTQITVHCLPHRHRSDYCPQESNKLTRTELPLSTIRCKTLTLLNLIADCEELEMQEKSDEYFMRRILTQDKYTV